MTLLHIGLSLSPTWLRGTSWQRPDSRVDELFTPQFWASATRYAEHAHLDFVLKPDALSVNPTALTTGVGFASPDPLSIMASLIGSTTSIGLIPTVSSRFSEPYDIARQLQSLNQFSRGRIGANIVTSLGGGEQYAGRTQRAAPTDLYADAQDFSTHLTALMQTFSAEAWLAGQAARTPTNPHANSHPHGTQFADPARISTATPHGRFTAPGPLGVPQYGTDPLPIVHAGTSDAALNYAAKHAHVLFAMVDTREAATHIRQRLRTLADTHQRAAPLLCPGVALQLAPTAAAAQELTTGPPPSHVRHWTITGTPTHAADEISHWYEAGAIDGFIALPTGSWGSLAHFTEHTVPLLSRRGLFRDRYSGTTLHAHLTEGRHL